MLKVRADVGASPGKKKSLSRRPRNLDSFCYRFVVAKGAIQDRVVSLLMEALVFFVNPREVFG